MIDTRELRIGNWVDYERTSHYVIGIYDKWIESRWHRQPDDEEPYSAGSGGDDYRPIELTPEILEKCGFVMTKGSDFVFNDFELISGHKEFYLWGAIGDSYELSVKIMTLHHLQNLYFAITGEELIFKP